MNLDLQSIKLSLQEAMATSMQGSYDRRLPDKAVLPKFREVLRGLRIIVQEQPSVETYRLLALAEEALLHYPAATAALEKAISLSSPADRKDLKRLALLREYSAKWSALGLTPQTLEQLGNFLDSELQRIPCDHTNRHTAAWIKANIGKGTPKILHALATIGGHCDCEVLSNIV